MSRALEVEGLWFLIPGAVLAGVVRGFSGFGTAMIYPPFAGQVLSPVWTLVILVAIDLIGPVSTVLRDGDPRDISRLGAGTLIGVPPGVSILTGLSSEPFRYAVHRHAGSVYRHRGRNRPSAARLPVRNG